MAVSDEGFIGRAQVGKAKRGGRRRPFRWVCPRYSVSGVDISVILRARTVTSASLVQAPVQTKLP
eukprot:2695836-Heterocapsa_arctica.AAC.1